MAKKYKPWEEMSKAEQEKALKTDAMVGKALEPLIDKGVDVRAIASSLHASVNCIEDVIQTFHDRGA